MTSSMNLEQDLVRLECWWLVDKLPVEVLFTFAWYVVIGLDFNGSDWYRSERLQI